MTRKKTSKKSRKDPFAEREAQKYERPVPSREMIMDLLTEHGEPMPFRKIAKALDVDDEIDQDSLHRRLRAMERDGQIMRNRREGFGLIQKMDLVKGRVIGHPDGFGFLRPEEGGDDLFMSARQMRSLLHDDRIVARVSGIDRKGRREGAVVNVLERANHNVVGRFFKEGEVGFVVPSNKRINQDIIVPTEQQAGAKDGQIVEVHIDAQPTFRSQPSGHITEILGDHMAPGMEIDIAIRSYELPQEWSEEVKQDIKKLPSEVLEKDKKGREDIRNLPLVTIDGEDARDFDDAVYCEKQGKGWRLLVAIADVSHYVKPDTPLDAAAVERGTSVYFPERVIPMLPEELSNGLCSLKPKVDRLCMVCEMSIDQFGKVKRHRFFEGVMHSHARLTYNEVGAMLQDDDKALRNKYQELVPHLEELYALYKVFRDQRTQRGSIDFETTETRIVFGKDRKIEKIVPTERNDAHKLIEECMIAANVAAAEYLLDNEIATLYRVHETPPTEKLSDLREFLSELGLRMEGSEEPEPKHYSALLDSIRERPDFHLIQTVLLRSMSQAVYQPENTGHFGLALEAYAHFTSPIRRYPDLLVHRAIRHLLAKKSVASFRYGKADMESFGEHCSMTSRRADEATYDAIAWLKCEYMMDKIGDVFEGTISAVTSFGLFIELDEIYVEGLIHVTGLKNDYYHFDPVKHRLTGERMGKSYRLADRIKVKVMRVDLDERKIDFELAD
ncbi:MAG: ribonuclease R [Gammaproteobacteria bacterium]|nr:ribonuclease R [Gammaproteobacteria bacterium]MDH5594267.1 ribonuclease R [Gammaproteobacteria bacterium]